MGRLLLMIPLIVMLTGCAHYFSKPGMSTAQFKRDKRSCEKTAGQAATRNGTRVCDEIERCLIAKGWTRD